MEPIQLFSTCVIWTRSTVLILSILIVILSLGVYNYNAIPVFLLLGEESMLFKEKQILYDMIQDRKLIATLVAAQASIFCPLFLLMSTTQVQIRLIKIQRSEIWRTFIEQFCQFLMPLGLGLSWIFCITFDKRTETSLLGQDLLWVQQEHNVYCKLAVYVANSLKYVVIGVLVLEVLVIWVSSFKYALSLLETQNKIRLEEEEEGGGGGQGYIQLGYKDEEEEE